MKPSNYLPTLLMAIAMGIAPGQAGAQKFNSLIPNPFVFCAAPRPCKICQPFRAIWKEICSDQKGAGTGIRETVPRVTPILQTVDQDGAPLYLRTVDGWTIQSRNRTDLEDTSLTADQPAQGVQVIDGPILEAQLRREVQ